MSTELERHPGQVLAESADPFAELMAYAETLETETTEDVQERILRSILASNSPEEILKAGASTPAEAILNIPIEILSLHPADSTYAEGPDKYLHLECRIVSNGDRITVSTSARDVVVKVLYMAMRGWLPHEAVIVKGARPTAAGNWPLFLKDAEAPF